MIAVQQAIIEELKTALKRELPGSDLTAIINSWMEPEKGLTNIEVYSLLKELNTTGQAGLIFQPAPISV